MDYLSGNLADRLIEMGVSKENIVIGFQSPFMRQFSDMQ